MPDARFDHGTLQALLEAELSRGNSVAHARYEPYGRFVVDLREPFKDSYAHTRDLGGLALREEVRQTGNPGQYGVLEYASDDEALAAPGWADQYRQLAAKARAEGRIMTGLVSDDPPFSPPPTYDGSPAGMERQRRADVGRLARAMEREMRAAKWWSETPPRPEAFQFQRPFAMDTMAFEQWMQFILLPRLRECAEGVTPLPPRSGLAPVFVREYDGREDEPGYQPLNTLLHQLDGAIECGGVTARRGPRGIAGALLEIFGVPAHDLGYAVRQLPWIVLAVGWTLGVLLFLVSGVFSRVSPWRTERILRQYSIGAPASGAWESVEVICLARQAGARVKVESLLVVGARPGAAAVRPVTSGRTVIEPPRFRIVPPLELQVKDGSIVGVTSGGRDRRAYDSQTVRAYLTEAGVKVEEPEAERDVGALREWLEALPALDWATFGGGAAVASSGGLPVKISQEARWSSSSELTEWQSVLLALPAILAVVAPCFWMVRKQARAHFGR